MKNKTTAAILGLFLGGFGLHRFYLGENSRGILYLLFFWTLIPFVIAFFDAIVLLMMDDDEFDDRYNTNYIRTRGNVPFRNVADEIEKLHDLMQRGILTKEEFEYKKGELL